MNKEGKKLKIFDIDHEAIEHRLTESVPKV